MEITAHHELPFLDRFEIVKELPRGGSGGRVFVVVTHEQPENKLVLRYFDARDARARERMERERESNRVAKKIGWVLEQVEFDGGYYMVMPFYDGPSLRDAVGTLYSDRPKGEALPQNELREVLQWMDDILGLLELAHENNLIHKDLNPNNFVITEEGAKIVDPGLMLRLTWDIPVTENVTEGFAHPDIVPAAQRGELVSAAATTYWDIWGVGATLYYVLEGEPIRGTLFDFERPVPEAVRRIVARAASQSGARYRTVHQMRRDLKAVLDSNNLNPFALPSEEEERAREREAQREADAADRPARRSRFVVPAPVAWLSILALAAYLGWLAVDRWNAREKDGAPPIARGPAGTRRVVPLPPTERVPTPTALAQAIQTLHTDLAGGRRETPLALVAPQGAAFRARMRMVRAQLAQAGLQFLDAKEHDTLRENLTGSQDAAATIRALRTQRLISEASLVVVLTDQGRAADGRMQAYRLEGHHGSSVRAETFLEFFDESK